VVKPHHQTLLKAFLSLFIVFHIFAVVILPNPESIVNRVLSPIIVPYGSFLGVNTTWRFFSPNPLVRLLVYEVFSRNADGVLEGKTYRYPRTLQEEGLRETFNRKFSNSMFMMARLEYITDVLRPSLCKWHPEAETIAISMTGRVLSSIEKTKFEGAKTRDELGTMQTQYLTDIHCKEEAAP
jgi:hypothetical protein